MYNQEKIKPYNSTDEKGKVVEEMFDNIAPTYDTLNHRLSWNIDKSWRKKAIKQLSPFKPKTILDIATGTGDFAILSAKMLLPDTLIGADISEGMMEIGRQKVKNEGLEGARKAVGRIVGRDTMELSKEGIIKATVETVAENFSDGIFAPMFYVIIGGPVLGYVYKVINTMDSMIGYKDKKYSSIGYAAAKLDDLANFIPSRIAGLLMVLASFPFYSIKDAWKIFQRDRFCHASPNSAQTESAVAGALGIQLAGDAYYFGNK